MSRKDKIQRLIFDSYLAFIQGSLGSKAFRKDFYLINGKKLNVLEEGNLSCAYFVSAVLRVFDLIPTTHTTVRSTVADMEKIGWKKISKPRLGCVIHWGEGEKSKGHKHIGFYIGNGKAISNSSTKGYPHKHHWTFGVKNGKPKRVVEALYWRPILGK